MVPVGLSPQGKSVALHRNAGAMISEEIYIKHKNVRTEKEMDHMCNLSKGVENRGIRKGIAQGHEEERLNSIKSLMETLNLTIDQAMQALKIPSSEREKYAQMLK